MADEWARLLHSLSDKRSSIEAAATFALSKPEQATELLAAIVARVQVRAPTGSMYCHAQPKTPL